MDALASIRKPVEKDMERYLEIFEQDFRHDNPLLHTALQHIRQRQGKRLRPILMLLVARAFGDPSESVLHASVSIELLHTASLVHDDIVDESDQRRGQASVNKLLSPQAAVLVGDYLLSKSLQHAARTGNVQVVENIARIGQLLADGELLQLYSLSSETLSEEAYFDVIRRKTASLFTASAEIGALLSGASPEQVEAMRQYGENLGICFQIRDDIFDYQPPKNDIGKPIGNDMQEGKLTLPVLFALRKAELQNAECRMQNAELKEGTKGEANNSAFCIPNSAFFNLAMKVRRLEATPEERERLVAFAIEQGGVEYAYDCMNEYACKAISQLSLLPVCDCSASLRRLAEFVVQRTI